MTYNNVFLDSIEASIPACHAGDPGSIPGRGVNLVVLFLLLFKNFFYYFNLLKYTFIFVSFLYHFCIILLL